MVPMRDRLKNGFEILAGAAQLSFDFGHALLHVAVDALSGREVPQAEPRKGFSSSFPQDLRRHPDSATDRSSKVA